MFWQREYMVNVLGLMLLNHVVRHIQERVQILRGVYGVMGPRYITAKPGKGRPIDHMSTHTVTNMTSGKVKNTAMI